MAVLVVAGKYPCRKPTAAHGCHRQPRSGCRDAGNDGEEGGEEELHTGTEETTAVKALVSPEKQRPVREKERLPEMIPHDSRRR